MERSSIHQKEGGNRGEFLRGIVRGRPFPRTTSTPRTLCDPLYTSLSFPLLDLTNDAFAKLENLIRGLTELENLCILTLF